MNDVQQEPRASVLLANLKQTIVGVKEDIKKFFSSTEGKGEKIKAVYRAMNNEDISGKRIQVRDVNFAIHTYIDDYYTGLKKFITEILSIRDAGSLKEKESEITTNIETAKSKDESFIKSLFDDLRNPINGDESIPNAMKSLEALIDFIDKLNDIESDVDTFMSLVKDNGDEKYVIDGITLYMGSVNVFINSTLSCIKDIFSDIEGIVLGIGEKSVATESMDFVLL